LEEFLLTCEDILQKNLKSQPYNTITSFIRFYDDYRRHKELSFIEFVSAYQANLFIDSLSCVGLTLILLYQLRANFSKYQKSFALVSCEESVTNIKSYNIEAPNTHKSHVVVALKFNLAKTRKGIVIFDPGFHLSKPIVAMEDKKYPHTSWFFYSKSTRCVREFNYEILDSRYILWKTRENKNNRIDEWTNLVYVGRFFQSFVNVTEKRSLLYKFKSLVIRNRKGAKSGVYLDISKPFVTIFNSEEEKRKEVKLNLNDWSEEKFASSINELAVFQKDDWINHVHLSRILKKIRSIINDKEFVTNLLALDTLLEDSSNAQ